MPETDNAKHRPPRPATDPTKGCTVEDWDDATFTIRTREGSAAIVLADPQWLRALDRQTRPQGA